MQNSKHLHEAYDALIEKLKTEIEKGIEADEKSQIRHNAIEGIFLKFIYKNHGKPALMLLAKEIDDMMGKKNDYTQFIDIEYED